MVKQSNRFEISQLLSHELTQMDTNEKKKLHKDLSYPFTGSGFKVQRLRVHRKSEQLIRGFIKYFLACGISRRGLYPTGLAYKIETGNSKLETGYSSTGQSFEYQVSSFNKGNPER